MQSGEEMMKHIVDKSAIDATFRQELLAEPRSTLSKEFEITIPDSISIHVHESDMQTVHIALPPDPKISEERLEAVSAGFSMCF